jgi:DNA-binding SARP family transcriptional activator/tetratricopeptide (TPR) repeat protein
MSKKPSLSIHARVLGDASITTCVGTIEPTAEIIFAAALYLVLQRNEPVSRGTIQALLWPEASTRVAAHRLRQTLLKLRRLGMPIGVTGKGHIGLDGTPVSVDYEEFLTTRKTAHLSNDALVMLPGYEPRFSQTYLEWLDAQKAEVNASLTRVMLGIIARHRVKGEWAEAERNAARLLRFQPYNEEATLAMAESCAMRGGKLEAMAILDRYLSEVGSGPTDLRVPATIMRRRIADRMHPRVEAIAGQSPMVGRGGVMEQLAGLLERSRRKSGQACLVWGDAGIGKSRVLAEFATFASLQGIQTQRVQCRPSDKHRPLSVFVDLVPGLRTMRGAIGCSPETFDYLDKLTKHKTTKIEIKAEESDAEFVYARVQKSLFDLIDAVSYEGCLMLLIEDVHWLDSTSAQLLREMVEWSADRPTFFVFTGRDQPDGWMAGIPNRLLEIHLPPLDPGPSKDVLLGVVRQHGGEIEDAYVGWCVRVAEGNPYFLQELANHWIETRDKHSVPLSLAAVLNERLSRIAPVTLQLLQTCAVLEKNSTLDRIEHILNYPAYELLPAINELAGAGMLVAEHSDSRSSAPDTLATRHDLLSNAALARLTTPALAFLHRRAAVTIEQEIDEERSAAILWDCAKHWQLAGDSRHAFELANSCATHLMDVGLSSAAAEAYEKTLTYCSTIEERVEILKGLAHAHYRTRSWKEVSKTVARLRKIMGSVCPDFSTHDEFELMALRSTWRHRDSVSGLESALKCLEAEAASIDHRVEAGGTALMISDQICDHDLMRSIFATVAKLCASNKVDTALQLRAAMVYHCVCGDLKIGVSSARLVVSDKRAKGNSAELFAALCNAGSVFRTAGLFVDAEAALREALDIAEQHKLSVSAATALNHLAHLFLELGQADRVRECFGMLTKQYAKREDADAGRRVRDLAVRLALIDGRYDDARQLTREPLKQVRNDPLIERRVYHLALIVAARLRSGGKLFEEAVTLLEEDHLRARVNARQAFATYTLCGALTKLGRRKRGDELLREYLAKYRHEPWPPGPHLLEALRL